MSRRRQTSSLRWSPVSARADAIPRRTTLPEANPMAKGKLITVRADAATKHRLEEAADRSGMTLSSFLLGAGEAAAAAAAKRQARACEAARPTPGRASGACPRFFKAICSEVRRGGGPGYAWAGRKLLRAAAGLIAWDTAEELRLKYTELENAILARDDAGVLGWFDRELPRCMALIPRRRRASFLAGVYREVEEDDGVLMP